METCFCCGQEFEPEIEGWSSFCSDSCAEQQRRKEMAEERKVTCHLCGEQVHQDDAMPEAGGLWECGPCRDERLERAEG